MIMDHLAQFMYSLYLEILGSRKGDLHVLLRRIYSYKKYTIMLLLHGSSHRSMPSTSPSPAILTKHHKTLVFFLLMESVSEVSSDPTWYYIWSFRGAVVLSSITHAPPPIVVRRVVAPGIVPCKAEVLIREPVIVTLRIEERIFSKLI